MRCVTFRVFVILFLYIFVVVKEGIFVSTPLFAQNKKKQQQIATLTDAVQFLSKEEKHMLDQGTALSYLSKKNQKVRLKFIPDGKQFEEVRIFVLDKNPTILYETLFFIKTENFNSTQKTMLTISNYVRHIPIFASIKYKNIKKGYIYPIFLSSQEIVSLKDHSGIQIIHPLVTLPQDIEENKAFVLQDMPPFGMVVSQYIYRQSLLFTSFTGYNITNILYNGIRSVRSEDMFITCFVIHVSDGVLVYGMGAVKVSGVAVLFKRVISNSFQSRMVGLFNWVKNEYEGKQQL